VNPPGNSTHVTPLRWDGRSLFLLDQRLLPRQEVWIECRTSSEVAEAIRTMVEQEEGPAVPAQRRDVCGVPRRIHVDIL